MTRHPLAPLWPVFCGALVLLTAGFMQMSQDAGPLGFLLSGGGFLFGAGGLVAWGRQKEAVANLRGRIGGLAETVDRLATKDELRSLHADVREIRNTLERRSHP